jgi:tetratricopeptide (TPR) repeat protein
MRRLYFVIYLACICLCWLVSSDGLAQTTTPEAKAQAISDYTREAQQALRGNHPDVAGRAYEKVLALDPNNVDARGNLGVVAMSTGNWSKAAEELEAALKLQPSQIKVQALLGICRWHLEQTSQARDLLSAALPGLENSRLKHEAGLALVSILTDAGEWDQANSLLTTLREAYPEDPAFSYAAFRVHSELEFQAMESLALNAPDSPQFHRALAEHLVNQGHTEAAVKEYQKAIEASPNSADLHFELGQALFYEAHVEARLAEAQKEFESAVRLNSMDARSECELGEIAVLRSDAAAAYDHFEKAHKINPEAACAKAGLAKQLMDKGNQQQALEYLQSAVHDEPYNDLFHYRLWSLYRQMGKKEEAGKEMEKFRQLRAVKTELQQTLHPVTPPE